MSEEANNPTLSEVEAALSALTPRPGFFDRDQLMFHAGRMSARRNRWAWPCATAASAALATLAAMILIRPEPVVVEHFVYVQTPTSPPLATASRVEPPPAAPDPIASEEQTGSDLANYFKLRDEVIRWGVEALPHAPLLPSVDKPMTMEQLLDVAPGTVKTPSYLQSILGNLGDRS